jgi:hypothetical protein
MDGDERYVIEKALVDLAYVAWGMTDTLDEVSANRIMNAVMDYSEKWLRDAAGRANHQAGAEYRELPDTRKELIK